MEHPRQRSPLLLRSLRLLLLMGAGAPGATGATPLLQRPAHILNMGESMRVLTGSLFHTARWSAAFLLILFSFSSPDIVQARENSADAKKEYHLFARTNLVAWCIVPFDARKRKPEERAAMLEKLGLKMFAYDYRAEHIPTFNEEIEALRRHHISLLAWWFPTQMNDEARLILDILKRHNLRGVQLWVMGGGETTRNATEQSARVESEAARIKSIAVEANKIGSAVGLYNHGGWFGEPENQLQIIESLHSKGVTNVGMVYNQHHGHEHVERFPQLLKKMQPYLLALNINGMSSDKNKAILPIGQGEFDLDLLRVIQKSGWRGPIGVLNHTDEDAEVRLRDNLEGLDRLAGQLQGSSP